MRAVARTGALLAAVTVVGVGLALLYDGSVGRDEDGATPEVRFDEPAGTPVLRGSGSPAPEKPAVAAPMAGAVVQDARASVSAPSTMGKKPWRLAGPSREPGSGDVRFRVVDGEGAARGGTRVQLVVPVGSEWRAVYDGTPDVGAEVLVPSVSPGRPVVNVFAGNLRRSLVPEVLAGRTTEIDLALPRGVLVEGQVRHVERGPLPGVEMTLTPAREEGDWRDTLTTRTDDRGRYRLEDVPTATWHVALAGGVLGPAARIRASLTVSGSGPVQRDFVVGRVTLEGRVSDASTGRPIANADVNLQGLYPATTTDARGVFSFVDAPAGADHTLSVKADGFGHRFVKRVEIPESDGEVAHVDVELQPAAALLLTLRDDDDRPVIGEVFLHLTSTTGTGTGVTTNLRTDDRGELAYRNVVPGSYRVGIDREGFVPVALPAEVRPGDNPLRVVLKRTPTRDGKRTGLHGVVRDAQSRAPIAGVWIEAPSAGKSCTSGSDGSWALSDMAAGSWVVVAAKDGYGFRSIDAVPVAADEDREFELLLAPAATVRFQAVGRSGTPLVGDVFLSVRSEDPAATRMTTTLHFDAKGEAVCRQIVPGRYRLRLRQEAAGFAEVHADLALGENRVEPRLE